MDRKLHYDGQLQHVKELTGMFGTGKPFTEDKRVIDLNSGNYSAVVPEDLPTELCGNVSVRVPRILIRQTLTMDKR